MKKCNSKQIKDAYKQYKHSCLYDLYHCYNNYSYAKQEAMNYCRQLEYKYNGYNLKIIGYNPMTFSVGFLGEIDNQKAFFYITKSYDRYILLKNLMED